VARALGDGDSTCRDPGISFFASPAFSSPATTTIPTSTSISTRAWGYFYSRGYGSSKLWCGCRDIQARDGAIREGVKEGAVAAGEDCEPGIGNTA